MSVCLKKHGNAKIASFKCCVSGLPEFSQLLLDIFNIADLQLKFVMPRDSITGCAVAPALC